MGLKKYEIITVGSDKRVRALRSWQVGDRYVNIGDVGGIVYDEKTLSQEGACWLFRGNFGFPGARIGGDSIVDVGEATLSTVGTPAVDILGSSVVVGSKLQFEAEQRTAVDVVLTAADFEQGTILYAKGVNWETWKIPSTRSVRLKAPIFAGGVPVTVKCAVAGYMVQAFVLDRDGNGMTATAQTDTGAGVTLAIPAGQYFMLGLAKTPAADTVPADATAAQITFTGTYETSLSIIDSRVEINPATSTGTATVKPGGNYNLVSGAKYPEAVIRNSKVSLSVPAAADRVIRFMGQIIGSTATLDATASAVTLAGQYSNVKNLIVSGIITAGAGVTMYNLIQATDCDNFAVSPTIFPGLAAALTANMPFIFQGCNMPNGRFYHHAQIANTYKNMDFALAQADLGKATANVNVVLVSSEVEGMYRVYHKVTNLWGPLVESLASVISLKFSGGNPSNGYATTIYKDAYFNGEFDFAGTNVFGNKVRSHPLAQVLNVAPRAVQGEFNTRTTGEIVTGVVPSTSVVSIAAPFRVAGDKGITVLAPPAGFQVLAILTDLNGKVIVNTGWVSVETSISAVANAKSFYAYISVSKTTLTDINPSDVEGTQIVVYNGCKIVNMGETALNMRGNIRVEDNATLINAGVVGSGYFGGNCVASGLRIGGAVFMSDNASFVKTGGSASIRDLKMTDNAKAVIGDVVITGSVHIKDNAVFTPTDLKVAEADFYLQDNAKVTADVSVNGSLLLKDNAAVNQTLTVTGCITLCGSYNQTATRSWVGKRTITDANEPEYDNNVKSKYDF